MQHFINLKLRWKLVSLILIPVICMFYLAYKEISKNNYMVHENEQILQLSRYAVHASALVHELQKERGFTAGFLGSKGAKFTQALPDQKKNTDSKIEALKVFLDDFSPKIYGPDFIRQLEVTLDMYAQLQDKRAMVVGLAISQTEAVSYFTTMNGMFIDSIAYLAKASSEPRLSNMASAYVNFLKSKERAGLERAVLTSTFVQDRFGPGVYDRFKSLIHIQDTYIKVFKSLATREQQTFFDNTMQGEFVDETEAMRAVATEHTNTGGFGVDPAHWFKMITGKINLLKSVEDKLSSDLEGLAQDLSETAHSALLSSVVVMLISLSLTIVFIYFVQRLITQPIFNAVEFADAIANGKFDNDIYVPSKDEAGQLLAALKSMQNKLSDAQRDMQSQMEKERVQAAENSRIRQALDNVSANVMVADKDLRIIYTNHAAKDIFSQHEAVIKRDLPDFNASALTGKHIGIFYEDPEHQCSLLNGLSSTHTEELVIGGRIFKVVSNPVNDQDGNRLGSVVEWVDLTEQRNAEQDIEHVINAAVSGKLDTRLSADEFDGFMNTLARGINTLLDAIIGPFTVTANCMKSIANGNIPKQITEDYQGDFNEIKISLNTCIAAINRLASDANMLADAAVQGQLSTRAENHHHQGDFRKIIDGVNNTLDAVINPLTVAAEYLDRIASGDIPEVITEEYNGDFNHIKNNLNTCISAIKLLVDDANLLATAAAQGQLSTRANESLHHGDFQKIIVGVNSALDAMVSPINECKQVMTGLAEGDLTGKIVGHYQGEFNDLKDTVNNSIENLVTLIEQILSTAKSIDSGSSEIASGTFDLSKRTESQAASLEQVASSMEEMTSTVNNSADNAELANNIAQNAQEKASAGRDVVEQTIDSMAEISASSKRITDIISVIDEIAFQTNLLALNAAVEAARAGEQGRGFAVVASEVRNLAQRSAKAAGEIKDLIEDSVAKVDIGSDLVDKSGQTLAEIVTEVQKVSQMIAEISEASIEQRSGISQINQAVGQMDGMTQQNAALVEQASAASQSMSDQVSGMKQLLLNFKT